MATLSISLYSSDNQLLSAFKIVNMDYAPMVIVTNKHVFLRTEFREIFGQDTVARYNETSCIRFNIEPPNLVSFSIDQDGNPSQEVT